MTPNISGDDNRIAGLSLCAAGLHAGQDLPHAGGGNEHAVYLSLSRHLGIAGNDLHPGLLVHGEALLNDKGAGEIFGLCAHTGQIIHRAADGELSDVAAGEKRRRDNKAIGGHCHFPLGCLQHRRIVRSEAGVGEMRLKHPVNELRRLASACAMSQSYCFVCHDTVSYSIPY